MVATTPHQVSTCILHILFPQLLSLSTLITARVRLEALEKLLSRAYKEEWADPGLMESLFTLFGLPVTQQLPVAPLTHLYDHRDSQDKIWLRADPVYLQADRERLLLFDSCSASLHITPTQANTLIDQLNGLYATDQLLFSAPTPTRWYVTVPQRPKLLTSPLPQVVGQDIYAYMPTGDDNLLWRQRLNEIQMLLHHSSVNLERVETGILPINSLWFWGLGQLPDPPLPRWAHVWSDEPLACGLACLTKTPYSPLPTTAKEWLNDLTPGEHLLTFLAPTPEAYSNWLNELDVNWFMVLLSALKKRQLDRIVLYPGDKQVFYITRESIRYWWRRSRHWQHFFTHFRQR